MNRSTCQCKCHCPEWTPIRQYGGEYIQQNSVRSNGTFRRRRILRDFHTGETRTQNNIIYPNGTYRRRRIYRDDLTGDKVNQTNTFYPDGSFHRKRVTRDGLRIQNYGVNNNELN